MALHHILKDLQYHTDPKKAKEYKRFFKSEYTDKKDRFIGVSLPNQRKVAKRHPELSFKDFQKLVNSDIHEYRMLAGILLANRFRDNELQRKEVFDFYINNIEKFNNWDLIDTTADKIIGRYLADKKEDREILYTLAESKNLWQKRASIISTLEFIRKKDFVDALKIAKIHLKDDNDLIHKAVGWILREIGNRNEEVLLEFLKNNYRKIPRTTLRYSIEKFPEEKRDEILKGKI